MRTNIFFILLIVLIVSACTKESQRQASKPFAGKVKTITDNTFGYDSIYLFYDSTSANLKKVIISRINLLSGDSIKYYISIWHNNNVINFKINTVDNDDSTGVRMKISTINKQITSISQVNLDNTETILKQIYINDSDVDSVFDTGVGLWTDIHAKDFIYANGNCTYYTSNWMQLYNPIGPVYGKAYDTLGFYYSNMDNTHTLLYQQPLEMNFYINNWFMLDLLQMDGYYILPHNNNLIDSFVNANKFVTKYSYEFNPDNKVSVVRINTGKEQHITYY